MAQISVGDKITFRAICRWPTRPITREVLALTSEKEPMVNAYGCDNFIVRRHEIRAVNGEEIENG